jgi:hypothetical protein
MMRLRAVSWLLVLLVVGTLPVAAQTDLYARKYTFPYPMPDVSWGNAIGGVDFDGDGQMEIYAVNNNMYDAAAEMMPVIYKYELDTLTGVWSIVWSDSLPEILGQNTWPALTYGDWDKDGKMEIIWGPVNNFVAGNETPDRIIVYETPGDGSDAMGVDDGAGGYRPNARWNIVSTPSYNLRPFRWMLSDIDGDGTEELIFCDRASSTGGVGFKVGVVSVSDIPDNGDGSETWTLEASGDGIPTAGNTPYDIVVVDSTAYVFHATTNGTVTRVRYRNGAYSVDSAASALAGVTQGGGFKTAQAVDFDGDGTMEIIMASYSSGTNNKMTIMQVAAGGDSLIGNFLFDPNTLVGTGCRLLGSAVGDIDNDGNIDVVFGSRDAAVTGTLLRVEYKGTGDVMDPSSYDFSILESGYGTGSERFDFVDIFNLDADPELEVLYGSAYGGDYDVPMLVLDRVTVPNAPEPIADVRISTNVDLTPDRIGETATVMGTVCSVNMTASANRFGFCLDDGTGGIALTKGSAGTGGGPSYAIGERLLATGVIGNYNGLVQLDITGDLATDVIPMGPVYRVTPINATIEQLNADGEAYESRLIKIKGIAKTASSAAWPDSNQSANMTFWDGFAETTLRIDNDADIDGSPEPVYPVDVVGTASQYDNSAPYNSGYQIIPNFRTDFTEGVTTSPNPNFALQNPADGSTVVLNDAAQVVTFDWAAAVDLDGTPVQYQWVPIGGTPVLTGNSGADTLLERTGAQLLSFLGAADTVELKWTVLVKDPGPVVANKDTASVTLIRGSIVGVAEELGLPTEFALQQNYPNPFNPTTTIRYALPVQSMVTVRVFDVIGREVATLVDGVMAAGFHDVNWNSTNSSGSLLSSGMYFYRIEARPSDGGEPFVQLKKMMLLK